MFQVISAMVDIVRKVQKKKKNAWKDSITMGSGEGMCWHSETSKRYSQRDAIRGLQLMHFTYTFFFGMIQATFIVYNRKWKRGFSSSGSWSSSTDSVSTLEKARTHFRDDDEFPSYLEVIRFWCCLKVFPLIFLPSGRVQTEKQLAGRGVCWLQQRNSAC